jgi:multisubunit Na+/H+ antiporter MnhE subunit
MTAVVLRVAGLVAIYLLVLTSMAPGDVLVGAIIGGALVLAARSRGPARSLAGWGRWFVALGRLIAVTAWDIAVGTVRVVRFSLGGTGSPGFVEIPRDGRSRHAVALWGLLTGEAPDEYPVAIDDERHVLIVHHVDAGDPAAIRARHATARERDQGPVVR